MPDVGATTLEVDPDYSTGYRLTLGYTLPNTFDVTGRVTRLNMDAAESAEKGTGELDPIALHVGPGNEDAEAATARYGLDYWVADVELGKSMPGTSNTAIRLFAGLRYASVDQTLDARYLGDRNPPAAVDDIPAGLPATLSVESKFSGVGVRLGASGEWAFARSVKGYEALGLQGPFVRPQARF